MRSSSIVTTALFVLGLSFLAAYAYSQTRPDPAAQLIAAKGDLLEITVAGEANGKIVIKLFEDIAPKHGERLKTLAKSGAYDNVVFHRVIDGFMAQTGDVQYGKADGDISRAGRGASDLPNLPLEPSKIPFDRGIVGMARASDPNSGNSQFFIMFAPSPNLNGQYTVVGQVVEGLDVLDAIKRGTGGNGAVVGPPDVMKTVRVVQVQ